MRRIIIVCAWLALGGCKKHESVQASPTPTDNPVVASTAPSVSVTADPIASIAPSASASAAPSASTMSDKELARQTALREAAEFGLMGILNGDGGAFDSNAFDSPLASGTGIPLGPIGHPTRYPGAPTRPVPSIRQGAITVNGRLPPEVIQRVVRQNFGRFRHCYEAGLKNNPSLQGRVVAKYVIDRDGSVKGTPMDGGSDLPDTTAVQCMLHIFQGISYPQPEGGIVSVVYPLIFNPGT